MEISGKIIYASELRGGVSKKTGNSWKMQEFVVETQEQYPRRCCFTVFGEDKLSKFNLRVGTLYNLSIDVNAREYNGRWYNEISCWGACELPKSF